MIFQHEFKDTLDTLDTLDTFHTQALVLSCMNVHSKWSKLSMLQRYKVLNISGWLLTSVLFTFCTWEHQPTWLKNGNQQKHKPNYKRKPKTKLW